MDAWFWIIPVLGTFALMVVGIIGVFLIVYAFGAGRYRPAGQDGSDDYTFGTGRHRPAGQEDDEMTERMVCLACGTTNRPAARFCSRCGRELSHRGGGNDEVTGRICPACGTTNRPAARFCSKCGQELG